MLGLLSTPIRPHGCTEAREKVGVAPTVTQSQNRSLCPNLHDGENDSKLEIPSQTLRKPRRPCQQGRWNMEEEKGLSGSGVSHRQAAGPAHCAPFAQTRCGVCDVGRESTKAQVRWSRSTARHLAEGFGFGPGGTDAT